MRTKSLLAVLAGAAIGSAVALSATPISANAATVCCYRWWGQTAALTQLGPNVVKTGPTITEIDWAQVWVSWGLSGVTANVRIVNANSTTSYLASGGTDTWVRMDPSGTLTGQYYGRCWWTYSPLPPGSGTLATYCDMKYRA